MLTGRSLRGPDRMRTQSYPVTVEDGEVFVEM
jgi:nitrite reductase/ring-hydroxylating ferredoxin subunit